VGLLFVLGFLRVPLSKYPKARGEQRSQEREAGAQFMVTGVLGPHSNAHGPNEFLHIPTGKRVTSCVARVLADHYQASRQGLTQGVAAQAGHSDFGDHGCC
jgi:hypothetical protein